MAIRKQHQGAISSCSSCNAVTRGSNVQVHRVIKVTIDDIEVTIFQPQIQEYCQKNNIQNDEDVITEAFLSDERSTMVVGRNNVAVALNYSCYTSFVISFCYLFLVYIYISVFLHLLQESFVCKNVG